MPSTTTPYTTTMPGLLMEAGKALAHRRGLLWSPYLAGLVTAALGFPTTTESPAHARLAPGPRPGKLGRHEVSNRPARFNATMVTDLYEAGRARAEELHLPWGAYLASLVRADLEAAGLPVPPIPTPKLGRPKKSAAAR